MNEQAPNQVAVFRHELDAMSPQFATALPAHMPAERFARVLLTAVQNNPDLIVKADRRSLWNAAMRAAQDGLLPDGRDGAIVLYGAQAQWMPMIGGLRKKVRNSGEIATWDVYVVHKNDEFEYELGDNPFIRHKPTLEDPGPVVAAYSVATLKSGEKSREVMTVAAIEKVRSASKAKNNGPWVNWYDEMCRKTVARRHVKSLPMSTDIDEIIRRDDELYDLKDRNETAEPPRTLASKLDALASPPAKVIQPTDEGEIEDADIGDFAPPPSRDDGPTDKEIDRAQARAEHLLGPDLGDETPAAPAVTEATARERGRKAFARKQTKKAAVPPEWAGDKRVVAWVGAGYDDAAAKAEGVV